MKAKFILLLLCLSSTAFAQDFQWVQPVGGNSNENVKDIELIGGHVYASGQFFGTVDFDPGAGNDPGVAPSSGSAYIAQFDTTGAYQWKISFDHAGMGQAFIEDMEADVNGNLVVLGSHIGDIDLDPGAATVTPTVTASSFVATYSPSGAYISHFEYSSFFQFNHISIDAQNSLYVCGTFSSPMDADPFSGTDMATPINGQNTALVSKILLSSDTYLWTRIFGGGLCSGEDIALGANGNLTFAGLYEDSIDLDPSASTQIEMSQGDADVFLVGLNAAGQLVGSNVIGSNFFDGTFDLDKDSQGNFIVSIVHYEPIEMNGSGTSTVVQPLFPASFNSDIVIGKYDANLDLVWAKQFGSQEEDNLPAIDVDFDQIAITGEVGGYASLSDFNSGTYFDVSNYPSNAAMYLMLIDANGDLLRSYLMEDYPINSNDILVANPNQIYIVGGFSDTCDFDPGLASTQLVANNGDEGYVLKLHFQSPPNAIALQSDLNWGLYPNPSNGTLNVYWEGYENANLNVFNTMGQKVYSELVSGQNTTRLALDALPRGQYIVRIEMDGQMNSKRFILY